MKKIFSMAAVALFTACFVGCSKDDDTKVVSVSEVAGNYAVVTANYVLNADGTITLGGEGIEGFSIDAVKVTVSGKKITATDSDGDLLFESVDAVEASNGVAFNLAVNAAEIAEEGYTVAGFEKYQLGDKKYQGFYNAKEKTFDFALALITEDENAPDYVIEFVGQK
jgi:hypothetical protein